jgi:hypothetical protein
MNFSIKLNLVLGTICFIIMLALLPLAHAQATLVRAKFGQDFISNVSLTNTKGHVGDHFEACVRYQIGWFTPKRHGGSIDITQSDVTSPQYALFAHSLPAGVTFDFSSGCLLGTPTESGQWQVYPGVRDTRHTMFSGHGYWFTNWTTDRNTGLVYATPEDRVAPTITIER